MKPKSWLQAIRSLERRRPISYRAALCLILALLISPPAPASETGFPVLFQDDQGQTARLDRPARRIVCLYAAFNEILLAMGLNELIAAKTSAELDQAGLKEKPCIGTHMRPNVELILALEPDLVLQLGGRGQAMLPVEQLRRNNIQTAVFNPHTFEELAGVIAKIGLASGRSDKAERLVRSMRDRIEAVQRNIDPKKTRPRIFFEVRHPEILAAGRGSIVSDVIRLAGGENCVQSGKKMVRMGVEGILGLNPDMYVVQKGPMNPNPAPPAERPLFQSLKAIAQGEVLVVDEALFSRPGPRLVQAVEILAQAISRRGRDQKADQRP